MAEAGLSQKMMHASNAAPTPALTGLQRQPSFSSFPSSRSPSSLSTAAARSNHETVKKGGPLPMARESEREGEEGGLGPMDESPVPSVSSRAARSRFPAKSRSQYPANSPENHVEYILVASFDVDRGSVMEHQYPGPISGDETMLAELMLPDQAHVRSQDWTIFFLHKDTTQEEQEREARRELRRKRRRKKLGLEGDDTTAGADADAKGDDYEDEDEDDGDGEDTDEESDGGEDPDGPPLIYVLNLVNTKQDNTVKR
jgi:hypothetical protein